MTDAALAVTQSAVEEFTERYLRSTGCRIEKYGDRWEVVVPDDATTEVLNGDVALFCATDEENSESDAIPLHPESKFFREILTEAGERAPTGKMSLESTGLDIDLPSWLHDSDVEVRTADFMPLYDRTAVVMLFQVSIETVSEYQRELLRPIGLDVRSGDVLPTLDETFLRVTSVSGEAASEQSELDREEVEPLLDRARNRVVDRVRPQLDETHREASRAADAEVEEYRQMKQQRMQELERKRSDLSSKIDELNERINRDGREERVRTLKERKELKSEYEDVDEELTDLRQRREQGFPERQREIRERHALDVRVSPLTLTEVEYERGEMDIELVDGGTVHTLTAGYGSGVGLTEEVCCASCDEAFSDQKPLHSIRNGLQCPDCVR